MNDVFAIAALAEVGAQIFTDIGVGEIARRYVGFREEAHVDTLMPADRLRMFRYRGDESDIYLAYFRQRRHGVQTQAPPGIDTNTRLLEGLARSRFFERLATFHKAARWRPATRSRRHCAPPA